MKRRNIMKRTPLNPTASAYLVIGLVIVIIGIPIFLFAGDYRWLGAFCWIIGVGYAVAPLPDFLRYLFPRFFR